MFYYLGEDRAELVARAAGAREPAERGCDDVALGAQRRQVVGARLVGRRVVDGPVVCVDGGLLAAQMAEAARAGEGLVACIQEDRIVVVVEHLSAKMSLFA